MPVPRRPPRTRPATTSKCMSPSTACSANGSPRSAAHSCGRHSGPARCDQFGTLSSVHERRGHAENSKRPKFRNRQRAALRGRMTIDWLAGSAATLAAVLSGATLATGPRRERHKWIRESAIEAYSDVIEASLMSGSACRRAREAIGNGQDPSGFRTIVEEAQNIRKNLRSRVRLLAPDDVVAATMALYEIDGKVNELAFRVPQCDEDVWDQVRRDVGRLEQTSCGRSEDPFAFAAALSRVYRTSGYSRCATVQTRCLRNIGCNATTLIQATHVRPTRTHRTCPRPPRAKAPASMSLLG